MPRRRLTRLQGSPVAQFALSGLVAVVLIGALTVLVSLQLGQNEAIRDAEQTTELAGLGIVEPLVGPEVLAGDPAALRRLDAAVRRRVLNGDIVRVKLWTGDGRIVYSDEPRLIGRRYPVDEEEREALGRDEVAAEVSDLAEPENVYDRGRERQLLEVYRPIRASTGEPLRFELYQRLSSVTANGREVLWAFAPALLGGLALLQLANLPLARSMAARLRRGQQEREALLHRALDASQQERRAVAADLHDGIVQDLTSLSLSLTATAKGLDGAAAAPAREALTQAAARSRDSVSALRALLIDIYPPSLHRAGLADALSDLATSFTSRGLPTTVGLAPDLRPGWTTERLLFRCAQEALRNALKHAGPGAGARVTVCTGPDDVVMEVIDDGRGFDPGDPVAEGHFGMRMLTDLVDEAGGELQVRSAPAAGTTVRVQVPR